jgi:hypothetical protein
MAVTGPSINETRREQVFPVLDVGEIQRLHRFGGPGTPGYLPRSSVGPRKAKNGWPFVLAHGRMLLGEWKMTDQPYIEATVDYDGRMQLTVARVFGGRDTKRHIAAIREFYADVAVLYKPDASASGHTVISETADTLLSSLPPDFAFRAIGPSVGHHRVGRLRWQGGPPSDLVGVI